MTPQTPQTGDVKRDSLKRTRQVDAGAAQEHEGAAKKRPKDALTQAAGTTDSDSDREEELVGLDEDDEDDDDEDVDEDEDEDEDDIPPAPPVRITHDWITKSLRLFSVIIEDMQKAIEEAQLEIAVERVKELAARRLFQASQRAEGKPPAQRRREGARRRRAVDKDEGQRLQPIFRRLCEAETHVDTMTDLKHGFQAWLAEDEETEKRRRGFVDYILGHVAPWLIGFDTADGIYNSEDAIAP